MSAPTNQTPDMARLYEVVEVTWPAARLIPAAPFTLRDGAGGGKRVSAATLDSPGGTAPEGEIERAASAMRAQGETPLFMLRDGDHDFDAQLAHAGYDIIDPVNIWLSPIETLSEMTPPRTASFHIWEPMAIQRDIWAKGGIGPARLAVMDRATCPKTSLFGRNGDRPAATGYVGLHDGIAMVHALEVLASQRRAGQGRWLMIEAARWAAGQGAQHMSVICTAANTGANALYSALGMARVGGYHYRIKKDED